MHEAVAGDAIVEQTGAAAYDEAAIGSGLPGESDSRSEIA
jgi:hypothetical protein